MVKMFLKNGIRVLILVGCIHWIISECVLKNGVLVLNDFQICLHVAF